MRGMTTLSLAIATLALTACNPGQAETPRRLPAPAIASAAPSGLETAVFSGGCFWGIQGVFQHVKGVKSATSGYAGGPRILALYDAVSTGTTGHAETVRVVFDPRVVSYATLLQVFFSVATDPTQVNAQYPDEGPQYRSEIWYANAEQARVAHAYIAQLNAAHAFKHPIATRVDPLKAFYPAEAYHQDYVYLHPNQPYIATFDLPKLKALKTLFPELYTERRALTG
jgi:peptide-methionine (S)-S-oxide reductase